ncbi:MAG: hypothetical protein BEN18_02370 [Epulopiscium sp. Nuni2H_MBin001]|nr:MAG: hypothetical protein BEN18_02370 [Epulopiscium sp. Nuni2H_MBin001]
MDKAKGYLKILFGSALIAVGLYYFWAPAQLAGGGVSGLSIVVKELIPMVPISVIVFVLDMIMFLIGFLTLGRSFGMKSITSSLSIVIIMSICEFITPVAPVLSDDPLILLIFGCLIMSCGQATIFIQEGSSGGTDIIAKIISKFTNLKIGVSLILADMTVVLMALSVFGVEKGLYAALGVLLTSVLIDYFISGITVEKYVMIIPSTEEKCEKIQNFILHTLSRGATLYEAKGAYSLNPKTVITTALDRREFLKIRTYIKEIDEIAFVSVQDLHEVMGEGFSFKI